MFRYFPLELPNIEEAMIYITTKVVNGQSYVIGQLYRLNDENADQYDYESRYSSRPFYTVEFEKDEDSNADFYEWTDIICEQFVKEGKEFQSRASDALVSDKRVKPEEEIKKERDIKNKESY